MLPSDIENLTKLLDKNASFTRPEGQTIGFTSEQPQDCAFVHAASTSTLAPAVTLPATIVDKQLNLPDPSLSRKLIHAKSSIDIRPKGSELWSQKELEYLYNHKVPPRVMKIDGEYRSRAPAQKLDHREEPEYVVLEKQSISAEDVYLGVDFTRDPSSCDGVVVKILMPKLEKSSDLRIQVEDFQLYVSAPNYYLVAALPRRCVAGKADAQWDGVKKSLEVHLVTEK